MLLLTNRPRRDLGHPPTSSSFLVAAGVPDALQTAIARIAALFDRCGHWDATTASPDAERQPHAERMKAALLLKR